MQLNKNALYDSKIMPLPKSVSQAYPKLFSVKTLIIDVQFNSINISIKY